MKVQIETPYRVSHLQRYGVKVRGNVTSVYKPLVAYVSVFPACFQSRFLCCTFSMAIVIYPLNSNGRLWGRRKGTSFYGHSSPS
jgi:hypothetical protein